MTDGASRDFRKDKRREIGPLDTTPPPRALGETMEYVAAPGSSQMEREAMQHVEAERRPGSGAVPAKIGRFEILRLLGQGGMGKVYEGQDPSGRRVAIKLISGRLSHSRQSVERFRREGMLASMVHHPRCVFILEADEYEDQPYIVMELMEGGSLRDLVQRTGSLDPIDAIYKTLEIIDGLAAAHKLNVLHRDIKPANCYLDENGHVKIGDFGLARSVTVDLELTNVGDFVGTALYSSPEQLKGERLDVRADVYSVAATLYYLVTGSNPYGDSSGPAAIARAASEPPPLPSKQNPAISPQLEAVILRGLERDKAKRFPDLLSMREALTALLPVPLKAAWLTRRIAAWLIDLILIAIFVKLAAALKLSLGEDSTGPLLWLCQFMERTDTISFFYLMLFEGLLGVTIGKWLAGLRIADICADNTLATIKARIVRVLVFVVVTNIGLTVTIWNSLFSTIADDGSSFMLSLVDVVLTVLGAAIILVTMRPRNGYRGIHEFASGTRVVQLPMRDHLAIHRWRWKLPDGSAKLEPVPPGIPGEIGSFKVLGAQNWTGPQKHLVVEDESLGRKIWLFLYPETKDPISLQRKELRRPTRLRWLQEGKIPGYVWHAFLAPDGLPLRDALSPANSMDWTHTRVVLEDLSQEFAAAKKDGTLPATLNLDQVFLTSLGEPIVLDFGAETKTQSSNVSSKDPIVELLKQTAIECLEGDARESSAGSESSASPTKRQLVDRSIRAPAPLHARAILDRLVGAKQPFKNLDDFRSELDKTMDRATEVTRSMRTSQLSLYAAQATIPLTLLFLIAHAFGLWLTILISERLVELRAIQTILTNGPGTTEIWKEFSPWAESEPVKHKEQKALEMPKPNLQRAAASLAASYLFGDKVAGVINVMPDDPKKLSEMGDRLPKLGKADQRKEETALRQALHTAITLHVTEYENRWANMPLIFKQLEYFARNSHGADVLVGSHDIARGANRLVVRKLPQSDELALFCEQPGARKGEHTLNHVTDLDKHTVEQVTLQLLAENDEDLRTRFLREKFPLPTLGWLGILAAVPFIAAFIPFLFRGEPTYWLSDLALVRRDGRSAGRFRWAWRKIVTFFPPFVVVATMVWIDLYMPQELSWCMYLRLLYIALPVALIYVAYRMPRRGPHDYLSGTYVVPQ